MRSYLCASLFYALTLLAVASCTEIHAEYAAVHQTHLVRRSRPLAFDQEKDRSLMRSKTADDDEAMVNSAFMTSTPLQDFKTEYIGSIGVGTRSDGSAQFQARVVFDTGSTNLWVASTLCKTPPCTGEHAKTFYDPQKSITQEEFVSNDKASHKGDLDVHFGSGELIGPLHTDHFHVGPLVVKKQPFAMIRTMNGYVFQSIPFEGILGLGFKNMSIAGIDPFFDHVIAQKLLTNNEFAFYMNVDSSKPSALLWGGIDKDLYHGPIRMFPVVDAHYWALELLDFKVGNTSLLDSNPSLLDSKQPKDRLKRLIVDSGTTYFTAPSWLKGKISQHLSGANCKDVANYPNLTYVLKGTDGKAYDLVVTQETYMIGEDSDNCQSAFWPLEVTNRHGPAMLLGEVFMRHFFTVFHRGDGADTSAKVGFAPANTAATPKVMAPTESVTPASFLDATKSGSRTMSVGPRATMASLGQSHPDVQPHNHA